MATPHEDESFSTCSEDEVIISTESSASSSSQQKRKKQLGHSGKCRRKMKKRNKFQKRKHKHCVHRSSSSESSDQKAYQPEVKRQKQTHKAIKRLQTKQDEQELPKICKKQITGIFRKYYGKLLRLLKTCSEQVPAEMFSKELIPSELIAAKKHKILMSLENTVHAEPEKIFDIIECLEEELSSNSILKAMKGKLLELLYVYSYILLQPLIHISTLFFS